MQGIHTKEKIRVGLLVFEPLRLAGLISICAGIDNLQTVHGDFKSLMADENLRFIVVDLGANKGVATEQVAPIRLIREHRPDLLQIALGVEDDDLVIEAILAGARAFLDLKAIPLAVSRAFREVMDGTIWTRRIVLSKVIDRLMQERNGSGIRIANSSAQKLTTREQQVLDLILEANSNREIAKALGIEERTVKAHLGHLMRKVGVTNRVELSIWALKRANMSIEENKR